MQAALDQAIAQRDQLLAGAIEAEISTANRDPYLTLRWMDLLWNAVSWPSEPSLGHHELPQRINQIEVSRYQ
jgi:hypothetical protein